MPSLIDVVEVDVTASSDAEFEREELSIPSVTSKL